LTEPGQSLAVALEMAGRLADGPAAAMAVGKRLIDQARFNTLKDQLNHEADGIATALGGAEGREGISAFLEKRKPDFRGLS
jgi:enoyl-CoA hydratase/carnithine racemase